MRQRLLIPALIIFLALAGTRQPALAGLHPKLDPQNIGGWSMAAEFLAFTGYYMYKNSPAQRAIGYQEELGPGEWYFAGYGGLSYLPTADWLTIRANNNPSLNGRISKNISFQPGPQVGLKFGRFFDSLPWFGMEVETNFSRNNVRANQGLITPPLPNGPPYLFAGTDWWMIWSMQVNLLARCGFLKDKEVTFGRLQPYVGIGPGWEVIYARTDSAKNFAFEALGGIRYMCTERIGIFFEYKFSYQYKPEIEDVLFGKDPSLKAVQTLDVYHHRFVIGVSYHFKNLFGN